MYLTVLILDVVLLAALFFVIGDIQGRVAYAQSPHGRTTGYAAAFSYSVLTRIFSMSGNGVMLVSPPTLDWVQVLGIALLALNAWFAYDIYRGRSQERPAATQSQ